MVLGHGSLDTCLETWVLDLRVNLDFKIYSLTEFGSLVSWESGKWSVSAFGLVVEI